MNNLELNASQQIKDFALKELGVSLIGICEAEPLIQAKANFDQFLKANLYGDMDYLAKYESRANPSFLLPNAKSVIVIGINYYREKPDTPIDHGRIARYAWGRDYHRVIRKTLKKLQSFLDQNWPDHQHRACTDSAPLMEKSFAEKAGLGFYGKHSIIINQQIGTFFLLGELITTLELPYDEPKPGTCGNCTRCIDACPTKAIQEPLNGMPRLDASKCISYLTIETKKEIPKELSKQVGNQIFGCDICQQVCPYNNSFAKPLNFEPLMQVRIAGDSIPLTDILSIQTSEEYLEKFAGSPLMRAKREGLIKNALNSSLNAIRQNPQEFLSKFLPIIETIAKADQSEQLREIALNIISQLKEERLLVS